MENAIVKTRADCNLRDQYSQKRHLQTASPSLLTTDVPRGIQPVSETILLKEVICAWPNNI